MTKDEALKLAMEALEFYYDMYEEEADAKAITAIQEHLAQPEQEPVAFENWHKANYIQNLEKYGDTYKNNHVRCRYQGWLGAQSFLPQRTWVGLTQDELNMIGDSMRTWNSWTITDVYFAIEAKLKEKNT